MDYSNWAASEPDPSRLQDRIRRKLFPQRHLSSPDGLLCHKDCISSKIVTRLSWHDRLRVLVTGIVVTRYLTVTENSVGKTASAAVCYIGTSEDWNSLGGGQDASSPQTE